jgi:hypothetical protein
MWATRNDEVEVRWIQSHVERRERNRNRWTAAQWGNWAADRLAGKQTEERLELGQWSITEVQYSDAVAGLYRRRDRPSEFILRWQRQDDFEVEVLGDVRRVIGKASLERNWEAYLRKRDGVTRRNRKWADLQWRLAHRAWAKSPGLGSAAQRFTRQLWALDLAPTGQRKAQRGYAEGGVCVCGQEQPDRAHVLLDCEHTKVDMEPIRATLTRSFAVMAAAATREERQTLDEVGREVTAWLTGEDREVLEDFLCGLWSARVSEQVAGEVDHRLAEGEPIELRRETLEKLYATMRSALSAAAGCGWEAWRKHNEERRAAEAAERRRGRQPAAAHRRQQAAGGQQDIRRFLRK